jgi:protein-tyrosine-phosphatase
VLFVCEHGALRSRLAEAFFNQVAPAGWRATSAGLDPQEGISASAVRLATNEGVEELLDLAAPRAVSSVPEAHLVVAVDCELPGAVPWLLEHRVVDEALATELRARAERLAGELAA